ncbi:MAG TPA: helix-turn-helix domain-containing protein, partial [Gillisia sp.]|nr:helix-turn-helix domain-containing protein [Gillisia sp.]
DFTLALENYLLAYNLALEKNNEEHQRENALAIAAIRNINGQHYAAAELYKRSLHLLKTKPDYIKKHYEEYLTLLYNLSISHLRLKEVDSAEIFALKGIEQTIAEKDSENYRDFVLLDAQINYYQKEYGKAKDTLLKYLSFYNGTQKAIKLYTLGKIEEKFNNKDLAFDYLEKIDSIISVTNDPFTEVTEIYQQLIMHSITQNDKQKQVEYIGKLIHYDSVLSLGKNNVINMAMASYDIPFLKFQKNLAEKQLQTKERLIYLVGLIALLGSLTAYYFFTRSRKMRVKLNLLLKDGVGGGIEKINSTEMERSHPASVPEEIRNDLLKKLERFEASNRYLCKNLDMSTLADELGTNTSYLSIVINHYKQMSFPNYLKDLRITAAIKGLNEDPQLLKFNYQGLADTFGFKTGESFSKAFFKKTQVYPSKFLHELKKRHLGNDF